MNETGPVELTDKVRQRLCECALDGMYIVQDGKVRYVNHAADAIFGYEDGELIGRDPLDLFHPEDSETARERLQHRLAGKLSDAPHPYRGIRKDGTTVYLRVLGVPVEIDGRPAVAGMIEDVTESVLQKENLSKMLRFERLLNELMCLFRSPNPDTLDKEIGIAQQRICEALDCDVSTIYQRFEELAGGLRCTHTYRRVEGAPFPEPMTADSLFPWSERELLAGRLIRFDSLESLPPEAATDVESWRHFGINSSVVLPLFEGAEVIGTFSFGVMHEERHWPDELVERLKLAAQLLAALLSTMDAHRKILRKDLVFDSSIAANAIADTSGRLIEVNRSAARLWGYDDEARMNGLHVASLFKEPDEAIRMLDTLDRAARWEGEFVAKRKDGSHFDAFCLATALLDSSGAKIGYQSSVIDISEHKQTERDLAESEAMLSSIVNSTEDLIWAADSETCRVYFANQAMRDHFWNSYRIAVPNNCPLEELFDDPAFVAKWRALYGRAASEGAYTTEYETFDGGIKLLLSLNPIRRDGEVYGISVFGRDITELKRTEELAGRQLRQVQALRSIDMAIAGSFDLRLELKVVVEQTIRELEADAVSVLLLNPHTQVLTYASGQGFRSRLIEKTRARPEDILGEDNLLDTPIVFRTPSDWHRCARVVSLEQEGFVEYVAAPMVAKGRLLGVLEVFARSPLRKDTEWIAMLEALAGQTAIAVENARLFQELQKSSRDLAVAYDATIEGWSRALDLRDKETEGHTLRVTEMTERLARAVGIDEEQIVHIRRGALLHDIGKMGVPDSILLKAGELTEAEWKVMRRHPEFALELLSPIDYLRPALDIPYCHHEKWDGTGYPRGLKGEEIPLCARLFAIVDIWDALLSDRPYRSAWPPNEVIEHIRALRGTHLDPTVVDLCLPILIGDGE